MKNKVELFIGEILFWIACRVAELILRIAQLLMRIGKYLCTDAIDPMAKRLEELSGDEDE